MHMYVNLGEYTCPEDGTELPVTGKSLARCQGCGHSDFWWMWLFPVIGKQPVFPPHEGLEVGDEIKSFPEGLGLYRSWYMTCREGRFGVPYVTRSDMRKARASLE
jgi:hypothetical protein